MTRAKGVLLGRRPKVLDLTYIARRREQGATWATIAAELDVSIDTLQRATVRPSNAWRAERPN
jgi:hypothetical protein